MSTQITINNDTDLNNLFTLNYNFDVLKTILSSLLKQNKYTQEQLTELTNRLNTKDQQISQLENQLNSNKIANERINDIEDKLLVLFKDREANKNKDSIQKLENDEIFKRIEEIEKELENTNIKMSKLKTALSSNKLSSNNAEEAHDNNEKIQDLEDKQNKLEKLIENLSLKVEEVNILDNIKPDTIENDNSNVVDHDNVDNENKHSIGNNRSYYYLIESIKKTNNMKFGFVDDKIDRLTETQSKLKLENGILTKKLDSSQVEISSIKSKFEDMTKQFNELKAQFTSFTLNMSHRTSKIMPGPGNSNQNNLDLSKYKELSDRIDNLEEEIINIIKNEPLNNEKDKDISIQRNSMYNINHKDDLSISTNPSITNQHNQVKMRLLDIDKSIKLIQLKQNESDENILKKIKYIHDQLKGKVNTDDLVKINENINNFNSEIFLIKERFSSFDEKALLNEVSFIKKKVDTAYIGLQDLRSYINKTGGIKEDIDNHDNQQVGKYVDIALFNDFKNQNRKDLEKVKETFKDLNLFNEETLNSIKKKIDETSVKLIEGK